MKKLSILSAISFGLPTIVSTACTTGNSLNGNNLVSWELTIPKGAEISYQQNTIFWIGLNKLIAEGESTQISGTTFIDFINQSSILEDQLAKMPAGATISLIDISSSLDLDVGAEKIAFSVMVGGTQKRFEFRWKVLISPDEYLDAWISKISKYNLTSNIYDHNRLVAFIRDANDMQVWGNSFYAVKLFELISDLEDNFNIVAFKKTGLKVEGIRTVAGTLANLSYADLINNSQAGIIISISYTSSGKTIKRELIFTWKIFVTQDNSSIAWKQNSRLRINLTDFNKLVDGLKTLDQPSISELDLISANNVISEIKKYIGSQTIDSFGDDVYLRSIKVFDKLTSESIQETLRIVVSSSEEIKFTSRTIKIDFLVSASDIEKLNSWDFPTSVTRINPNNLQNLITSFSGIDQNNTDAAKNIIWSALAKTFLNYDLLRFPAHVRISFNPRDFLNLGPFINNKRVDVKFKLHLGSEERQISIPYLVEATQQQDLNNLVFNHLYLLSENEYEALRVALIGLPVNTTAETINDIFEERIPSSYAIPKLPEFAMLSAPISLHAHTGSQSVRDLIVRVKGTQNSARRDLTIARIIVSKEPATLLNAIAYDTSTPIVNRDTIDSINQRIASSITMGSSHPSKLSQILTPWEVMGNLPSKAVIESVSIPSNLVNSTVYEIDISIRLDSEVRQISLSFRYVTDYLSGGYIAEFPKIVKVSSVKYLEFANAVNALNFVGAFEIIHLIPHLDNLFTGVLGYQSPSINLGYVTSFSRLPTTIATNFSYFSFSFSTLNFQFRNDYVLSIEIEDTPAESLQAYVSLVPDTINFQLNSYNDWFSYGSSMPTNTTADSNEFIMRLFANAGVVNLPALPSGTRITSWSLRTNELLYENSNNRLTINFANGSVTNSLVIDLNISTTNADLFKNYFSLFGVSKRNIKLNSTQFNTLSSLINGTTYTSFNTFARAINQYIPTGSLKMTELLTSASFRLENQLEYQLVDFGGTYSTRVSFIVNNDPTTRYQTNFSFEVVPDYAETINQIDAFYATGSPHAISIANTDFILFVTQFNMLVTFQESYVKSLRLNALLRHFNIISDSALPVNNVAFEITEIPSSAMSGSSYNLDISYSAPGINSRTGTFRLTITKTLVEQVSDIQPTITDTSVTRAQFNTFATSWNNLSSASTTAEIMAVITTNFGSFTAPATTKLMKVSPIDAAGILGVGNVISSSKIYTLAVKVVTDDADETLISLLYFSFVITIDDDDVVNLVSVPNFTISGTRLRMMKLHSYTTDSTTVITGVNGKLEWLDKIKQLFKAEIRLPLADFNFRSIAFNGIWTSASTLSATNRITVTYGYRSSVATKTFTINVNLVSDINAITEDFSSLQANEVNARTFKLFDTALAGVSSMVNLDTVLNTYLPAAARPNFVTNWSTILSFQNIIRIDNVVKYNSSGKSTVRYLLLLKYSEATVSELVRIELTVPIQYDLDDQTKNWTYNAPKTFIESDDLVAAQTYFNENYPAGNVSDKVAFLKDLNEKFFKHDLSSIVPFDTSATIIIPSNGLIEGVHLFAMTEILTLDFKLKFGATEYPLTIQFGYRRSNAILFSLYQPYTKPTTVSDTVELLYSEYEIFREEFNLSISTAIAYYLNITAVFSGIHAKLVEHGYISQNFVPTGITGFGIFVSPYTPYLDIPKLVNNSYEDIAVKVGFMTKISSEIRFFEFKIKIKSDIADVVKTKLQDTIWRAAEQLQFVGAANQVRFNDKLEIYSATDTTEANRRKLMTGEEFKNKLEGDFGIIVGDSFNAPKLTGNKEVMYGFTKKGTKSHTPSSSYDITHEEDGVFDEYKPLTKTMMQILKKTSVDDIRGPGLPSFVDDPSLHPYGKIQVPGFAASASMAGFGVGLGTFGGTLNLLQMRGETANYLDRLTHGWMEWYYRHYGGDNALIPIDLINRAVKENRHYPTAAPDALLNRPLEDVYGIPRPTAPGTGTTTPPAPGPGPITPPPVTPGPAATGGDALVPPIRRRPADTHVAKPKPAGVSKDRSDSIVSEAMVPPPRAPRPPVTGAAAATAGATVDEVAQIIGTELGMTVDAVKRMRGFYSTDRLLNPTVNESLLGINSTLKDQKIVPTRLIYQTSPTGPLIHFDRPSTNAADFILQTSNVARQQPSPADLFVLDYESPLPPTLRYDGARAGEIRTRYPNRIYTKAAGDLDNQMIADPANYIDLDAMARNEIRYVLVVPKNDKDLTKLMHGKHRDYPEYAFYHHSENLDELTFIDRLTTDSRDLHRARVEKFDAISVQSGGSDRSRSEVSEVSRSSREPKKSVSKRTKPVTADAELSEGSLERRPSTSSSGSCRAGDCDGTTLAERRRLRRRKAYEVDPDVAPPRTARTSTVSSSSSESGVTHGISPGTPAHNPPRTVTATTGAGPGATPGAAATTTYVPPGYANGTAYTAHEVREVSRFSSKWLKRIQYATAVAGVLTTVGGFLLSMWQAGIWFVDKSNFFENGFDKEDKTVVNNTAVTHDYEFTAYVATKNSDGKVTNTETIQTYNFRTVSHVLDYHIKDNQDTFSKPLDHIIKEMAKKDTIDEATLKQKVDVSPNTVPPKYKNNNDILSGSWMGYLQMFPIAQTLDALEVAMTVKNTSR